MQAELYTNPCKICQNFKKRNTIYGRLSPKNIVELKLCNMVHVDLIFQYSEYIRQQQSGGAIVKTHVSLI